LAALLSSRQPLAEHHGSGATATPGQHAERFAWPARRLGPGPEERKPIKRRPPRPGQAEGVSTSQDRFVAFVDSLAVHLDDHAAHVLTFAAHNGTLVVLALKQAGIEDLGGATR
jgi:hypothetical protein